MDWVVRAAAAATQTVETAPTFRQLATDLALEHNKLVSGPGGPLP